jgi:rhodanese-related sulfurtransferase
MYPSIPEISVQELAERLQAGNTDLQLIDVREPYEVEMAALEGFTVLPLSSHAQWAAEMTTRFDPTVETWVLCHHGMRSAQMCHWLQSIGFVNVKNIAGGIDAYSVFVDPRVPRY